MKYLIFDAETQSIHSTMSAFISAAPSSMVGSIGVIYNGFGFVDGMEKVGVVRWLQTSSAHKAFLDQVHT